ncbi:nuclear transcription factor Y subunit B-1-like [Pyrus ussuriensis x Pyrus communis]|uniref:Nuclear transcription factor Y subunit B-1-like n=1 Tax=Pyrus ussuriensis x Pyrus communis TaxID=2448454 RepID=A0A5N5GUK9_9ROSA|nr:nuclear transcription factor Y subunit B-1-like [Pyrus ussuriensis x Pyrus communis]
MNPPLAGSSDNNTEQRAPQCLVREQDRYMPIANVIRIMRRILPPHAKISDDAKETMQECANERCQREQRKTVTAEDVLWAMGKLGFDNYVEPLTIYLQRYREDCSSSGDGGGGSSSASGAQAGSASGVQGENSLGGFDPNQFFLSFLFSVPIFLFSMVLPMLRFLLMEIG